MHSIGKLAELDASFPQYNGDKIASLAVSRDDDLKMTRSDCMLARP